MSEIICPHCKSPNSFEAEICSVCKKPLFEPASSPFENQDDQPDWLSDLRDATGSGFAWESEETDSQQQEPFNTGADGEEEIPDWLQKIRQRSREELGLEPEEGLETAGEDQPVSPFAFEDTEAAESSAETPTGEIPFEETGDGSLPGWMTGQQDQDLQSGGQAKTGELPGWMTGGEDQSQQPEGQAKTGELPGWLTGQEPHPGEESQAEDFTAGLFNQDFSFSEEGEPPAEQEESLSPQEGESDWLKQFQTPEESVEIPLSETTEGTDWLTEFQSSPEPVLEEGAGIRGQDWFGTQTDEPAPDQEPDKPAFTPQASQPEPHPEEYKVGDEFLGTVDAEGLPEIESISESLFAAPETEPDSNLDEEILPFSTDGLPDWFNEDKPLQESLDLESGEETGALEPAQLPGWLQAMQPVEAVAPKKAISDSDQRVEASGPLAGYQGVLPGEKLVTRYTKPPVYSAKLQVSESQRVYANLLESLVHAENEAAAPGETRSAAPHLVGRLLVGIILVVLVAFMLLSGAQISSMPTLFSPETVAFFDTIQSFSNMGQPARLLVAINYEAGLSGEMKTVSTSILADLLAANHQLVFVSDNVAGSALAESLVEGLPNSSSNQPVNLGYLAGGTAGLAGFASQPRLALPVTSNGQPAWNVPALDGIYLLGDFDGLILISDNAENARSWIEQVRPAVGEKPFLVIASAQIAPMVLPYVESGQVSGLLSGVMGSASYEELSGKTSGPARIIWDSYQLGMLAIVALILIGALFQGIISLASQRKNTKKA